MCHPSTPTNEPDSNRRFAAILTAVYGVWVLFVCFHHEPWRDEADVWLAARDMSLGQLFHWLAASGTPGLWYVLLMPLAKLGFPYHAMIALHAPLAIAGAAAIAFWAPFPRVFKILIVFSYSLVFEYAVVARSYVLTALLLFLIAAILTARIKRPLSLGAALFLLFNANVHGFFIAGIIFTIIALQMARRREFSRRALIGMSIALLGGVLAFVQLLPPSHVPPVITEHRWPVIGYVLGETFFPHFPRSSTELLALTGGRRPLARAGIIAIRCGGAAIFLSVVYLMRRSRMALTIVILAWAALMYIGVFQWFQGERHSGLFFLVIVFGLWVSNAFSQSPRSLPPPNSDLPLDGACRGILAAGLCVSCAMGALWSYRQVRSEYSGAMDAADFLRHGAARTLPIAVGHGLQAEAIIPYLPGARFWFAGQQAFSTYTRWDRDWKAEAGLDEAEAIRRVRRQFPAGNYLLLIASHPLRDSADYRLVFENRYEVFGHPDEVYYLYAPRPESERK